MKLLVLCALGLFLPLSSMAGDDQCQIPKELKLDEEVNFASYCSLKSLRIDQEKFVLVPAKKAPLDEERAIRYIGLSKRGLVFQVSPEGEVKSVMRAEPWKTSAKALPFVAIMKKEFSGKSDIQKKKEQGQ